MRLGHRLEQHRRRRRGWPRVRTICRSQSGDHMSTGGVSCSRAGCRRPVPPIGTATRRLERHSPRWLPADVPPGGATRCACRSCCGRSPGAGSPRCPRRAQSINVTSFVSWCRRTAPHRSGQGFTEHTRPSQHTATVAVVVDGVEWQKEACERWRETPVRGAHVHPEGVASEMEIGVRGRPWLRSSAYGDASAPLRLQPGRNRRRVLPSAPARCHFRAARPDRATPLRPTAQPG